MIPVYLFRITEEVYIKKIQAEIAKVCKLQENLDIDVLVHGEPEVEKLFVYLFYSGL